MIVHLVLFEPRADLPAVIRKEILDTFSAAVANIPSVRNVRVGRRIRHGLPGYEQAPQPHFEYVALIEFDDLEGLKTYLHHPAHEAAGQHFTTSSAAALAYDYAVVPAGEATSLVSKNE